MSQHREGTGETGGAAAPGPADDPRAELDALGEDVASSPARRGHEDPEEAARRDARAAETGSGDAGSTGSER